MAQRYATSLHLTEGSRGHIRVQPLASPAAFLAICADEEAADARH